MSTLPPKADITERDQDVRFVPKTDKVQRSKIRALFDHLISAGDQRLRHVDRRTTPDHLERRARKKQGAPATMAVIKPMTTARLGPRLSA